MPVQTNEDSEEMNELSNKQDNCDKYIEFN